VKTESHTHSLHAAVTTALRGARADGRPHWVALRARMPVRDGLEDFDRSEQDERFHWERPDRRLAITGLGCAFEVEAEGDDRFDVAAQSARELFRNLHLAGDPGPRHSGPLLVGGFAFASISAKESAWRDFAPCHFVLPSVLYAREDDEAWCTLVRRVAAGDDLEATVSAMSDEMRSRISPRSGDAHVRSRPRRASDPAAFSVRADRPHADYRERVEAALAGIHAGDLEKVVLARSLRVERDSPMDTGRLLDALREAHPSCTLFAVARPSGIFLGATPEHLVRLSNGCVETAAVAGTAPRSGDPEADARHGQRLLESKKEQAEHAIVVRALRNALEPCCKDLDIPEAPRLLRLGEIQHLETAIRGRLSGEQSVLDLVGRLHPTPAVGGAPRAAANDWIASSEGLDRGWYAGPVGFVDASGDGEFCVALRSALVRGCVADLYAGAGIVDGSLPEAELRETRLKFHSMLAPLLEV
jgi:isochorismate synthase